MRANTKLGPESQRVGAQAQRVGQEPGAGVGLQERLGAGVVGAVVPDQQGGGWRQVVLRLDRFCSSDPA
jgi:hypothetical protein